jgi:hypothetical protein
MHVEDSINKVTLARRTGRTPAAITKWVRRGLPVRADGTISWAVARVWIKENVNAARSGSYGFRQRQQQQAPAPAPAPAPAQTPAPAPAPAPASEPAPPVTDASSSPVPFTVSQAKKEESLAALRAIEVEERRGELAPVAKVQGWVVEAVGFERKHTWTLPILLREHGHAVAGDLAERLLLHIFHDSDAYMRRRAKSYGIALPPPLPPPPPAERLPSYLQYARDSISGETGVIPPGERLGSAEWRLAHPSIGIQEEFAIMAKKRAWDTDMAALLNRRKTWDLPPESDALKERADADTTLEES